MNNIILIPDPAKAVMLKDMGFTPCGTRQVENKDVFQFVATDELLQLLKDTGKFSKKDYVYDSKLTF